MIVFIWQIVLHYLCYSDGLWGGGPQPTRLGMLASIADVTRGPSSKEMDVLRKRSLTRPWDHTVDRYLKTLNEWFWFIELHIYVYLRTIYYLNRHKLLLHLLMLLPLMIHLPLLLLDMSTTHRNIPMRAPLILQGAADLHHLLSICQNNVGWGCI